MSLQFKSVGYINFNKDYNKVLKSGAITVSFTSSTKVVDGSYKTQYFNGIIPAKLKEQFKPLINKELCDIKGVINQTQKGYVNFTILEVAKHELKPTKQITDEDIPF